MPGSRWCHDACHLEEPGRVPHGLAGRHVVAGDVLGVETYVLLGRWLPQVKHGQSRDVDRVEREGDGEHCSWVDTLRGSLPSELTHAGGRRLREVEGREDAWRVPAAAETARTFA